MHQFGVARPRRGRRLSGVAPLRIDDALELRRIGPEDVDALVVLGRDYDPKPRSNEWLARDTSRDAVAAFVEEAIGREIRREGFWAGVWCKGELVGVVGLEITNPRVALEPSTTCSLQRIAVAAS